ncbi:DNA-binding transcriptional regulator, LysR family [Bosea sp. OK403]|nr:DNA-binding transcriptional regulator, LysR family [Bosea sp. OK403]
MCRRCNAVAPCCNGLSALSARFVGSGGGRAIPRNSGRRPGFAMVARERSFTKAGAKLGVSQSALSQTIKGLEERLKLRLLTHTTRSVAPTEAGIRLLETVGPRFEKIEAEIAALGELRGRAAGTIRITAGEHPAISILQPALRRFLPDHPDIKVEIIVDYGLVDIVAAGYDAGVRLGEQVAKDMVAVRIGPEMRMAIVGSPTYFERYGVPRTPQDLTSHNCIASRLPTYGGLFAWGWKRTVMRSRCVARASSCSTASPCGSIRRWMDLALPICRRLRRSRMCRRGAS